MNNAVPVFITLENSGGDTQLALQDFQTIIIMDSISGGDVILLRSPSSDTVIP